MIYTTLKATCLTLLLFLSGCAYNTQYTKLAPSEWTALTCSGIKTWHDCWTQARAICPNGYYAADHLENVLIQRRVVSVTCKP